MQLQDRLVFGRLAEGSRAQSSFERHSQQLASSEGRAAGQDRHRRPLMFECVHWISQIGLVTLVPVPQHFASAICPSFVGTRRKREAPQVVLAQNGSDTRNI